MKKTTLLRKLIEDEQILVAPGAHDVLTAKVIEKVGFNAVYMTGYGRAASYLGKPDVGLITMTEMQDQVSKLAAAVDIPVIADGDTGFGNAINVMRTVKEYEKAGAAAIQLEDQVAPKKCGHMIGRQVVSMDEMLGKIEAAISARQDPDFVIIARTDARTSMGFEEALKRAKAYAEAGADVIFFESPESKEEMIRLNKELNVPTLANMVEGGRTPLFSAKELEEMGYALVIFPTASVYTTAKSMMELMQELKSKGTTRDSIEKMIPFQEFNDLIGLPEIRELENKYVRGGV
ncbi:2,3-dimethylmalate lyase [Tepidanaerobacter acetatoxydans Re1]|uniref:2-methylisocitrate lyase n=1 Tax=Tepidanaerobacter acetatoxydans (strain DSM 21804 / JCM 16047 / Re1) TaxID=1209989 RepID=F4LUN8_TEPAE|nr:MULTISPECIES: isocitrate lyase/PEP mutase family protein [Tepidanaerobacter]AEE90606.1 Carboxyvinyl-carboxyphosphonate phosphorylmutase [Tepidanaerobacter acetatoxydans Re1]CCP25127.1 2,3-dimethylmalate lyase [Tepidanaerobacter acetatoxydans Re1]